MNVLVIGGGGREHALAWALAKSARVARVYVAPGNPGTAAEAKVENVEIGVDDVDALIAFAHAQSVGLTVVGPEGPLVDGIRDRFDAEGLACFGPSQQAAQLEGSKAYANAFMARHGIPTAASETFSELAPAEAFIRAQGAPIVIKADGLAAGKGVVVAQTEAEAIAAARGMLAESAFGAAGAQIVIEEFMPGEEASFIVIADGKRALPFASSQDHKPIGEGDEGPNTGGMGAYSPAPVVDAAMHERVMREVIEPAIAGCIADGMPFQGFLYAGLMIGPDGQVRVVEFNCRFGDPEAEPVLARLSSDLLDALEAALAGRLDECELVFRPEAALGVVMASGGYPGSYETGLPIAGAESISSLAGSGTAKVFHAGTARSADGELVTNGGRVLCVVGLGDDVAAAQTAAYAAADRITWQDRYMRRDIGYLALER